MIIELLYYSVNFFVVITIITVVLVLIGYTVVYFTLFMALIRASYFLKQEEELIKFIKRNKSFYLDVFFRDSYNSSIFNIGHQKIDHCKLECIKLNNLKEEDYIFGNYYYESLKGNGMFNKYHLKYLKTSNIYDELDNWNNMKYKLSLPSDVLSYIGKFIADRKCLKKERTNDIKYFNSV